ncbi:MAG: S-adenosylmethionine:tRNA ribosyltransferase-isomerase [Labilithrix sp.]|nr:S-adenosylmethionine:tRNA ribosyltransferase-isomerase [Labilithrix sp.]MCW5809515.1 S-adenosylmethionine:tRNA ribosyltransferase-isomerase [Labilithrix sp.]
MYLAPSAEFARLFDRGDLLVVNDAATLPASLQSGDVEVRLLGAQGDRTWTAALLGAGDWRTRTEDRPAPPSVRAGDTFAFGHGLTATIARVHPESPRLVTLRFSAGGAALWSALYAAGRPVQYAHVPEAYALWDVQNAYAGRPWAVEMPSAGRVLTFGVLAELERRGVEVATLTHAAGISSIGDEAIDALLPLPERYEVPRATWDAVLRARRVVAIGTSVTRALETVARTGALAGITDLRIGPSFERRVVDGILTGVHETTTSHFELLGAFAPRAVLDRSLTEAEASDLLAHEMGDVSLLWGAPACEGASVAA